MPSYNPFSPDDYNARRLNSARDALVLGLDTALLRMQETLADITEDEYIWHPFSEAECTTDDALPDDQKRLWTVRERNGGFTYDYADETRLPPPFTTIAWIMTHIAHTAAMYFYCVKSGKGVDEAFGWGDLPTYGTQAQTKQYLFEVMGEVRAYLLTLESDAELNKITPKPSWEMRPTYLNIWGGCIEHAIQHAMQIAVRKERIRAGY